MKKHYLAIERIIEVKKSKMVIWGRLALGLLRP